LLFFYSDKCGFTKKVQPEVKCVEQKLGKVNKQQIINKKQSKNKDNKIRHQQANPNEKIQVSINFVL
jgi:hypothetical protein